MLDQAIDVKIACPGLNWMKIGSLLSVGLDGYYSQLPQGSTVSAVTGSPGRMCLDAPMLVAEKKYHLAITTPSWYAKMAVEGKGPFEKPLPLRAIAAFPHDDRLGLAVRTDVPIHSLREIREKKYPLKISMPTKELNHPAGWVVEELLRLYGASVEDITSWGGQILRDRPRFQNSPKAIPIDPQFDAIFDEAIITRRWWRVANENELRFLPLDDEVVQHFEEMGMTRGWIAKDRLKGVHEDILTIDFSGWLLFCHEDMPHELGYLTARALDEQHDAISAMFAGEFPPMTSPICLQDAVKDTLIPLHDGARDYYREQGYL